MSVFNLICDILYHCATSQNIICIIYVSNGMITHITIFWMSLIPIVDSYKLMNFTFNFLSLVSRLITNYYNLPLFPFNLNDVYLFALYELNLRTEEAFSSSNCLDYNWGIMDPKSWLFVYCAGVWWIMIYMYESMYKLWILIYNRIMDFPTSMKKGWSKIDIQFYASVSLGNAQFTHEYDL